MIAEVAWCEMPVPCTNYVGDDGPWLVDPDPDWPGTPARPPGRGWIWAASAADILRRFGNLCYLPSSAPIYAVESVDVEVYAAANPDRYYSFVHERLYEYGLHSGFAFAGPCGRGAEGCGWSGYDIEGRGGAWVRRIDPMPDVEDEDD